MHISYNAGPACTELYTHDVTHNVICQVLRESLIVTMCLCTFVGMSSRLNSIDALSIAISHVPMPSIEREFEMMFL